MAEKNDQFRFCKSCMILTMFLINPDAYLCSDGLIISACNGIVSHSVSHCSHKGADGRGLARLDTATQQYIICWNLRDLRLTVCYGHLSLFEVLKCRQ